LLVVSRWGATASLVHMWRRSRMASLAALTAVLIGIVALKNLAAATVLDLSRSRAKTQTMPILYIFRRIPPHPYYLSVDGPPPAGPMPHAIASLGKATSGPARCLMWRRVNGEFGYIPPNIMFAQ
jgi:hypothetical protein